MSATNQSPETVLRQIDAIMAELQVLRQTVQALLQAEPSSEPLATQGVKVVIVGAGGTVRSVDPSEFASLMKPERVSAWDIIQAAPGQRQFRTAEDVAQYLHEERSAWED